MKKKNIYTEFVKKKTKMKIQKYHKNWKYITI